MNKMILGLLMAFALSGVVLGQVVNPPDLTSATGTVYAASYQAMTQTVASATGTVYAAGYQAMTQTVASATGTVYAAGYQAMTQESARVESLIPGVFGGPGTTGTVASVVGDVGKVLGADGMWVDGGDKLGGYISGCWPQYVDSDTVIITNGDGYCSNAYFCINASAGISVDSTVWSATASGFQYYYISYSGSTFPNSPAVYATTNLPAFLPGMNQWVDSLTNANRLLGTAPQTNTSSLLPFSSYDDGAGTVILGRWEAPVGGNSLGAGYLVVTNGSPDSTFQNIAQIANMVPTTASHAMVGWIHQGTGAGVFLLSPEEYTKMGPVASLAAIAWPLTEASDHVSSGAGTQNATAFGALKLGISRTVSWIAFDAYANTVNIVLSGYKQRR